MVLLIATTTCSIWKTVNLALNCPMSTIMHFKCRNTVYPQSDVNRLIVSNDKVSWEIPWLDYSPAIYTSAPVFNKPWADPEINRETFKCNWNTLDGSVNRVSHMGSYKLSSDGHPLNPIGRTGLAGRGLLGRWGPNHAADPIVTRWQRTKNGEKVTNPVTQKPILQFVAIERRDCKQWAIPGGMVDPGEIVTTTLQREFMEEALNSLERDKTELEKIVRGFFAAGGEEVYKGYVDDPRNTDNAWMETVAVNFHDEKGDSVGRFPLEAGDDARKVSWMDMHSGMELFASHKDMLKEVAKSRSAHW